MQSYTASRNAFVLVMPQLWDALHGTRPSQVLNDIRFFSTDELEMLIMGCYSKRKSQMEMEDKDARNKATCRGDQSHHWDKSL